MAEDLALDPGLKGVWESMRQCFVVLSVLLSFSCSTFGAICASFYATHRKVLMHPDNHNRKSGGGQECLSDQRV